MEGSHDKNPINWSTLEKHAPFIELVKAAILTRMFPEYFVEMAKTGLAIREGRSGVMPERPVGYAEIARRVEECHSLAQLRPYFVRNNKTIISGADLEELARKSLESEETTDSEN